MNMDYHTVLAEHHRFFSFLFIYLFYLPLRKRRMILRHSQRLHSCFHKGPKSIILVLFFTCEHICTLNDWSALQKQHIEDICGGSEVKVTYAPSPSQEIHDTVTAPFNLRETQRDKKTDEYAKTNTHREKKRIVIGKRCLIIRSRHTQILE